MEYFKLKNWERFQHYKNRNPSWVKLYTSLLDDFEFLSLPDETKALAFMLMMLAAKTGNKMPLDQHWLQNRLGLLTPPNLDALFAYGLLAHIASKTLAVSASKMLATEKERETERKNAQKGDCQNSEEARAAVLDLAERLRMPK